MPQASGKPLLDEELIQSHERDLSRIRVLTRRLSGVEVLSQLVEALPDALVVIDGKGEIVLFNRQSEVLFEYPREEVLGKRLEILVPESLRVNHTRHRKEYETSPETRPMGKGRVLAGRKKSGDLFYAEINLATLSTSEGVFYVAIVRRRS